MARKPTNPAFPYRDLESYLGAVDRHLRRISGGTATSAGLASFPYQRSFLRHERPVIAALAAIVADGTFVGRLLAGEAGCSAQYRRLVAIERSPHPLALRAGKVIGTGSNQRRADMYARAFHYAAAARQRRGCPIDPLDGALPLFPDSAVFEGARDIGAAMHRAAAMAAFRLARAFPNPLP